MLDGRDLDAQAAEPAELRLEIAPVDLQGEVVKRCLLEADRLPPIPGKRA